MRVWKALWLAALITCSLGVASAQAGLPEFSGSFPDSFTTSSSLPKFETEGGSLNFQCGKSEGKGEVTSAKAGTFDELFLECKAGALGGCIGLTDTIAGSILFRGTATLGFKLGTLVPLVALFLSPEAHFECGGLLLLVRGCLLGTTTLVNVNTATWTFKVAASKEEVVDYTSESGGTVACEMEASLNAAAFKGLSLAQTVTLALVKSMEVKD
jgi:hypothetical protein